MMMHTRISPSQVAVSDHLPASMQGSVALKTANDFDSRNIGLANDVDLWAKSHPGVRSWHDMDKRVYHELYKDKSIFDRFKHERSQRFELGSHKSAFEDWMARLGEFYNNIIVDVFYGVLLNEVNCCSCGTSSYYYSMFSGLEADTNYYVPQQGKDNLVNLSKLIAHSFAPNYEENCYCFKCKENLFQKHIRRIYRPPDVLMVSFYENPVPNNLFVKLDTSGLNLSDYSFKGYQAETIYNLRGMVNKEPPKRQPVENQAAFRSKSVKQVDDSVQYYKDILETSRFSELVYYCDFSRHWMHLKRSGLEQSANPEIVQGSNSISFCIYELST